MSAELRLRELSDEMLLDVFETVVAKSDSESEELCGLVEHELGLRFEKRPEFFDEAEPTIWKALWGSPGGKKTLRKALCKVIPDGKVYVEPFAGSASVFFAKEPSEKEVLSDIADDTATALRAVRDISDDGIEKLKKMNWTSSRETFNRLKKSSPKKGTIEWLHGFLYVRRFSYGNEDRTYSPYNAGIISAVANRVLKHRNRLKGVIIECADYTKIVEKYDSKDTVFFFDPPSLGYVNVGIGEKDFSEEKFVKMLKGIKGKFILTYGSKGKMDLGNFNVKRVKTKAAVNIGNRSHFTTLVASNFEMSWPSKKSEDEPSEEINVALLKTQDEHYVLGVVLEPNDGDNEAPLDPDTQKDVYSDQEIKQAAFGFMEKFQNIGHMHRAIVNNKVKILESYLSPVEFWVTRDGETSSSKVAGAEHVRKGTWLLGLRVIDKDLWGKVKSGELNGLSIGGSARRVPADA